MARLEDMETFVSVVEAGTISGAAERLNIAKSAVSRRVSELEARLGTQLFRRTTRRMSMTDEAKQFYERSLRILADVEEAEQAVADENCQLQGRLRIAMPLSFGLLHMKPAITDFMELHPGITFDLDFNDSESDILAGGFDLAIRIANLADSTLIARRIAPVNMIVCASPDYINKFGKPVKPEELVDHACLTYSNLRDPCVWAYSDFDGKQASVRVNSSLNANSGDFMCQMAIAGKGITRQPTFILYEAIAAKQLIPVLTDVNWPGVNAYAVYPQTRHLSRRVRVFVDFLVERFAGIPYWDAAMNLDKK